jgi:hypothetical protein
VNMFDLVRLLMRLCQCAATGCFKKVVPDEVLRGEQCIQLRGTAILERLTFPRCSRNSRHVLSPKALLRVRVNRRYVILFYTPKTLLLNFSSVVVLTVRSSITKFCMYRLCLACYMLVRLMPFVSIIVICGEGYI